MFCLILLCILLCGCIDPAERILEPVSFCYLRAEEAMETGSSVLAWEEREASGHRSDLEYLLSLYLMGPIDETLQLPVPKGTSLVSVIRSGNTVTITLSEADLTDIRFTLTGACFAMTCMELTDAEEITLVSGSRSVTMREADIVLLDDSIMKERLETP